MADTPGFRKANNSGCSVLKAYAADWMLPDSISIRDGGSCNVVVVVPYGYPGEDDNAEILGAFITNELDCYAVVNNRLYFTEGRDRPNKLRADLGSLTEAKRVQDYWLPLYEFLRGIPSRYESPVIVIFIHAMKDAAADKFDDDLMFTLGKGFVGEYDETKASASEEFFGDLLQNLVNVSVVTDEFEEYAQPCTLPIELRIEFGKSVEAATIAARGKGCRDSATSLQAAAELIAKAIKGLSLFKQSVDQKPIHFADPDYGNYDIETWVGPDGVEGKSFTPRTFGNKTYSASGNGQIKDRHTSSPVQRKETAGANEMRDSSTDEKATELLLTEDNFLIETGLSRRALKQWEKDGFVKPKTRLDNVNYYSEESSAHVRAMMSCQGRCANLTEAHKMALQGASEKKKRNEQIATSSDDGGHRRAIGPKEIKTHSQFADALPVRKDLLQDITHDMLVNGYRPSEAIYMGTWPEQKEPVVIDGHTRRLAAIAARVPLVPVVIEEFDSLTVAWEAFVKSQILRRPNDQWVRYRLTIVNDRLMARGGDRRSKQAKSKGPDGPIERGYPHRPKGRPLLWAGAPGW